MTGVELVKISIEQLKMMSNCGIKLSDWKYVQMYEEYMEMRLRREKWRYIIAYLAEKYTTSESSIKRLIKRFSGEVSI